MAISMSDDPLRPLLSRREVAAILACSERYVKDLTRSKRLRSVRVGKLVRVRPDDLARFMDELDPATRAA